MATSLPLTRTTTKMDIFSGAPAPFLSTGGEPSVPWARWIGLFDNFLTAIGGNEYSVERKRAMLLTCLGPEGQRVHAALPTAVKLENEDDFMFEKRRLTAHFTQQTNVCAERYRFRSRSQQPGETVAAWVTALRQLAASCEYDARTDEFIRDQVVERTASPRLRQRLLMEGSNLTLSTTLTIAATLESADRESRAMESPAVPGPAAVQAVQHGGGARRRRPPRQQQREQQQQRKQAQQQVGPPPRQPVRSLTCYACGAEGHRSNDSRCPAKGVHCHKCGKLNHYARLCQGQRSAQGYKVVSHLEVLSIGQTQLQVAALVCGREVDFVVDTGSPVTILPRHLVSGELEQPDQALCVYSGAPLQLLGKKEVEVSCKGLTKTVHVYVVPYGRPLMGLDLMGVFGVGVVNNQVCNLPTGTLPESPQTLTTNPQPPSLSDPPREAEPIQGYQHRVEEDPSVPPVRQPLRRLPLSVQAEVGKRLDDLEAQGIIEKVSSSRWVSPLVVGRKRDGQVRLCVDMRQVNRAVVPDAHPLPRITDVLDRLSRSRVFTRLDLKDAYHQLELHPASRHLTTFVSHQGLYRFNRVNFGLASAGPCFQRVMTAILKGVPGCETYLDDVIIHAPTAEEHDARVREVLERFQAHKVRVNWAKSVRSKGEISFLGYLVSESGVRIDPERVRPLLDAPDPTDEKSLRAFLGSVGYHARFLPHFADLVEPLRAALRTEDFQWTVELTSAVRNIKQAIHRAPALSMFDPELKTILTTDSSDVGCGGYLSQLDGHGVERVIAFASKSFSPAERAYSVVEKEALACVFTVEKWRHYLWGRRFLLRTDHRALTTIFGPKGSNRVGRRIARWEARMAEYSFDVEYIRSEVNAIADGLSRLPVRDTDWNDDDDVQIAALVAPAAVPEQELRSAVDADESISLIKGYVAGQWPRRRKDVDPRVAAFYNVRFELSTHGPHVFRGDRLVIPEALRARVLSNAHAGHQGVVRTKQRLRELYWWPGMDREVQDLVKACPVCSEHDAHARRERPPLQPIPRPERAWQRVMIDAIGPMKGPSAERYGLVLCDLHSRWPEAALCSDITAATAIAFLESVFAREGVPDELICDNGPCFRATAFGAFLQQHGVRQVFSSPYSPQTCGLVERMNRTVKDAFQAARLSGESRSAYLRRFLGEYRATPHPATGVSPFLLMRGREPKTGLNILPPAQRTSPNDAETFRKYQAGYTERFNGRKGRKRTLPKWEKGDWVRVRRPGDGRVSGQPAVQVHRRTGPVSYRLTTGERVHARRLVEGCKPQQNADTSSEGYEGLPFPLRPSTPAPSPVPESESSAASTPAPSVPRPTPRSAQAQSRIPVPLRKSARPPKPKVPFSPQ